MSGRRRAAASSAAPRRSQRRAAAAGRDPLTGLRDGRAARAWIAEQLAAGEGAGLVVLLLSVSRYDAINAAFGRATGDAVLQAAARRIERHVGADGAPAAGRAHGRRRIRGAARRRRRRSARAASSPASWSRRSAGRSRRAIMSSRSAPGRRRRGRGRRRSGRPAAPRQRRAGRGAAARTARRSACSRTAPRAPPRAATGSRSTCAARSTRTRSRSASSRRSRSPTGAIVGVEALARWKHPQYGELGALTLFGVAEGSDYLVQLSDHVQRKAIARGRRLARGARGPAPFGQHHRRRHLRPGFAAQFLGAGRGKRLRIRRG